MSFLENLSISKKLLSAFLLLVAAISATSAVIYQKLDFIERSSGWTVHTYEVLQIMNLAMAAMVDQETGVRGHLLSGEDRFLEPYRSGGEAFAGAFRKVKELTSDNPEQQTRLDEMSQLAKTWRSEVAEKEIALMAKPETQSEARAMEISGAGKKAMDGIRAKVAEIKGVEQRLLTARLAAQKAAFTLSNQTVIFGALVSLTMAIILGFVLTRGIARPILQTRDAMKRLADGDTSLEVPGLGRKDEVGAMAQAVEVFKANMIAAEQLRLEQEQLKARAEAEKRADMSMLANDFEASVKGVVQTVSSASTQLQSTAASMSSTAEETSRQAQAVSAASEQATANMQTVASSAEELTASVNEIGRQVVQATKIAGQAVLEADGANATVQSLSEAAQKIGTVVKLISDIASQTNLLALNATIEAARAGEAGKGFAVVASEVKNLASQTAKATDEIAAQVTAMQGATSESVHAIGRISETIREINGIAATIASAVEEQGAATQEIARNVQQAAVGTSEVSTSISGVTRAAADTGFASSQVLDSAGALSKDAEALRAEVESFIVKVRAA
ncbi:MAG: methyl-accepting chemotaxis protein [Elsteraceae bacterium]